MADKASHSGAHGLTRVTITRANKARRAARRQRLALKRGLSRASVNRRIRWLTRYAANLRRRIEAGEDRAFRLAQIEAELARELT